MSDPVQWWVCCGGTEPYVLDERELLAQRSAGTLDHSALIWAEGQPDWQPLNELPALLEEREALPSVEESIVVAGSIFGGAAAAASFELPALPAWELSAVASDPYGIEPELFFASSGTSSADDSAAQGDERVGEQAVEDLVPSVNVVSAPAAMPAAFSGFGRLLREVVETERSYLASLEQLLASYRPALEPLAPTLLGSVFDGLLPLRFLSEELLGAWVWGWLCWVGLARAGCVV